MEYLLKVSPKGQVTIPKKLRQMLEVSDRVSIKVVDKAGIMKRPPNITEEIAGCFRQYAKKRKLAVEDAVIEAREIVARERAAKDR